MFRWLTVIVIISSVCHSAQAQDPPEGLTAAERGYWLILNKPYLVPEFDQHAFDNLYRLWPKEQREQAEQTDAAGRRELAFERYGLTSRPDDDSGKPLQYVVTEQGGWMMNCFTCHGGKVAGEVIPGLANSEIALQTLTEETRNIKPLLGQSFSPRDLSSFVFPMGSTVGTTNAVMFGVALENYRDHDMNVVSFRPPPQLIHHDMDAPALWHFKKKSMLYCDGFVEKNYRALIPFVLIKSNGPKQLAKWESDFQDIYAYLESLEAPAYPFEIDETLAERGKLVFEQNCAECHGTYGDQETYPEIVVEINEIGTDPVRYRALSEQHRENYGQSWLSHYGRNKIITQPKGYIAPPLDGIWASAPYFHNGSVPTLWHVLHAEQRPVIWKRPTDEYDQTRLGHKVSEFNELPDEVSDSAEKRTYFDTRKSGKSAAGHLYPENLSERERASLLEYLKTL